MTTRWLPLLVVVSLLVLFAACDDEPAQPSDYPPVFESLGDTTVALGDTLVQTVVAADPENGVVKYELAPVLRDDSESDYTPIASIHPETGEFVFIPRAQDMPERSFVVSAKDLSGETSDRVVTITVPGYCVDQVNDSEDTGAHNVELLGPTGQEFVPNSGAIQIVELRLMNYGGVLRESNEFFIRIHQRSLGGPVIAVSETLRLPSGFDGVARFRFETTLLLPRVIHVMELVGDSASGWLIGDTTDQYAAGRMLLSGEPVGYFDMWFRLGNELPCSARP